MVMLQPLLVHLHAGFALKEDKHRNACGPGNAASLVFVPRESSNLHVPAEDIVLCAACNTLPGSSNVERSSV